MNWNLQKKEKGYYQDNIDNVSKYIDDIGYRKNIINNNWKKDHKYESFFLSLFLYK